MTHEPQAPLARIKLPPALIIISALAAGAVGKELGLDGPDWGHLPVLHYLGKGLMAGGLLMLILGYGAMMRAWTTIDPGRHTRAIVTRGIFRISRNPIYLGWSVGLFGAGLARSSLLLISYFPGDVRSPALGGGAEGGASTWKVRLW